MVARLDRERVERQLKDMKNGESAWTTPWAMSVTHDKFCYLNENYTAHKRPGGTVSMLVHRNSDGNYEVDITGSRHKWVPSSYQNTSWFAIPVVRLTQ